MLNPTLRSTSVPTLRWLVVIALGGVAIAALALVPRSGRHPATTAPSPRATPLPRCQDVTPPPSTAAGKAVTDAELDDGIRTLDATRHEITRGLLERLIQQTVGVMQGARIVPAVANGRPSGFKLYAIRPCSIAARLGFESGDTVQSLNGLELTSPENALEAYLRLRTASEIDFRIIRRRVPLMLRLAIVGLSEPELTAGIRMIDTR